MGLISGLGTWCFWTVVLEKTLESPLDSKEIQPVRPKGNQSWIFIGRTDAEAETPILWPPDSKNWFIWKNPDAGKDWGQEEKGDDRGGDGWMVSLTRWTWVWASSRRWWWTGKPGVLQSMVLQRVGQDWATEMNWTELGTSILHAMQHDQKNRKKLWNTFPISQTLLFNLLFPTDCFLLTFTTRFTELLFRKGKAKFLFPNVCYCENILLLILL